MLCNRVAGSLATQRAALRAPARLAVRPSTRRSTRAMAALSRQDELKMQAAAKAVEYVKSNMVVGLGTGGWLIGAPLRVRRESGRRAGVCVRACGGAQAPHCPGSHTPPPSPPHPHPRTTTQAAPPLLPWTALGS